MESRFNVRAATYSNGVRAGRQGGTVVLAQSVHPCAGRGGKNMVSDLRSLPFQIPYYFNRRVRFQTTVIKLKTNLRCTVFKSKDSAGEKLMVLKIRA